MRWPADTAFCATAPGTQEPREAHPHLTEQCGDAAADQPATAAAAIAVSLDSTFVRSSEDGERHLEVRVGNVETTTGGRQVFAAVAKADTDIAGLIRRDLETVGKPTRPR